MDPIYRIGGTACGDSKWVVVVHSHCQVNEYRQFVYTNREEIPTMAAISGTLKLAGLLEPTNTANGRDYQ